MAKTSVEIFNDKVKLIYEYNKKSPLFVRMANTEISDNNVERAIEILNNGIKLYPEYAAAYLLLGKALTITGSYTEALKAVKKGCSIIHSNETYEHYLKEIELIKKQRSLFHTTRRSAFLEEEDTAQSDQPGLFEDSEKKKSGRQVPPTDIDNRLEEIAHEISGAKIPEASGDAGVNLNDYDEFSSGSMIVSETLAKIYTAQGEYSEAIKVYDQLKRKNPSQSAFYDQKIKELKSEFDS